MAETASQLFLQRASRRASMGIVLVAGSVLIGWLLHLQNLKSVYPGLIAMNPLSALLFIIAGFALLRTGQRHRKRPDVIVMIVGIVVLLGGATKIAECFFPFDLDLDQILFHRQVHTGGPYGPNEIAMNTAVSFACCGLALLSLDVQTKQGYRPAQVFILIEGLIALLTLIGYGYRVLPLSSFGSQIPMALNSAICFELFAAAALSVRPSRGLMMVITSD